MKRYWVDSLEEYEKVRKIKKKRRIKNKLWNQI